MKKVILTMVLALASVSALAQDAVKVYGVVDVGVSKETSTATKLTSGLKSGSFLGFTATEALGNGTSASVVLEAGVDVDTGTSSKTGTRQSYVSLANKEFGTVKLGRQLTPLYFAISAVDPQTVNLAGNFGKHLSYEQSSSNTVSYTMPELVTGLTATASYSFAEGNRRKIGASAQYTAGDLTSVLGYENVDSFSHTFLAGAVYDFKVVKTHAIYSTTKTPFTDARDVLVGVSTQYGQDTVSASVVRKLEQKYTDQNTTSVSLAYVHPLSKRTSLYTSVSHTYTKHRGLNSVNAGINMSF